MGILNKWLLDLPQQFQNKRNIEVLIKAFSRQLEELNQAFKDLEECTDADSAVGQNLDYAGTIVNLTRKEAGILAGTQDNEPLISDERYRNYIKYKILSNTSICTYEDIMESINILWDVEKATYYENPDRPATILIKLPETDIDEGDPTRGKPKIIKPAGVAFFYVIEYIVLVDGSKIERFEFPSMTVLSNTSIGNSQVYKMRMRFSVENKEEIDVAIVTKKDLWYLDGEYLLDGERVLGATEEREEL